MSALTGERSQWEEAVLGCEKSKEVREELILANSKRNYWWKVYLGHATSQAMRSTRYQGMRNRW